MGKTPRQVSHTSAVEPTATIRTMILCIPDELPREALTTAQQLDRNFGVQGTPSPWFWASSALRLWQHRQMIGLCKGRPAYCTGGPVKLLDLDGMRKAAVMGAGIRHQLFSRVVQGTPSATPWHFFESAHLRDPQKLPWKNFVQAFNTQPRVNAIRMYNAATCGTRRIALNELEMYQAGYMAYQHYSALTAIAGDALITAEGATLAPASDTMADRVTYLEQANRLITTINPDQRLLAVAV